LQYLPRTYNLLLAIVRISLFLACRYRTIRPAICGRRDPGIRIHWNGAGGFKFHSG
jgi:hypothetical protein